MKTMTRTEQRIMKTMTRTIVIMMGTKNTHKKRRRMTRKTIADKEG